MRITASIPAYLQGHGLNVTIKLRMSAAQEAHVRAFYNMDPERPMFCRTPFMGNRTDLQFEGIETAEAFSVGNGWYIIYGDGLHEDSALKAFAKLHTALQRPLPVRGTMPESVQQNAITVRRVYAEKRRVFVVVKKQPLVLPSGRVLQKSVAITRAVQADANRVNVFREEVEAIKRTFKVTPKPNLESAVAALQRKFGK